eukprot:4727201-Amphidinium_carterae.3
MSNLRLMLEGVWQEARVHSVFEVGELCVRCGEAVEDLEHIVHHCPAWATERREVELAASALDALPALSLPFKAYGVGLMLNHMLMRTYSNGAAGSAADLADGHAISGQPRAKCYAQLDKLCSIASTLQKVQGANVHGYHCRQQHPPYGSLADRHGQHDLHAHLCPTATWLVKAVREQLCLLLKDRVLLSLVDAIAAFYKDSWVQFGPTTGDATLCPMKGTCQGGRISGLLFRRYQKAVNDDIASAFEQSGLALVAALHVPLQPRAPWIRAKVMGGTHIEALPWLRASNPQTRLSTLGDPAKQLTRVDTLAVTDAALVRACLKHAIKHEQAAMALLAQQHVVEYHAVRAAASESVEVINCPPSLEGGDPTVIDDDPIPAAHVCPECEKTFMTARGLHSLRRQAHQVIHIHMYLITRPGHRRSITFMAVPFGISGPLPM